MKKSLDELKIAAAGRLGANLLRILNLTLRWERVGFENSLPNWPNGDPIVLCFWHGHQLFMPWLYLSCSDRTRIRRQICSLSSAHRDGRMMAATLNNLGISNVTGSSTRGATSGVRALLEKIEGGAHIAITPDGPRGPSQVMKMGAVKLAQWSQSLILPAAIGFERKWCFKSWDSMMLPKPFSRAVFVLGKPLSIPAKLSKQEVASWASKVQAALNAVTAQADGYFDRSAS